MSFSEERSHYIYIAPGWTLEVYIGTFAFLVLICFCQQIDTVGLNSLAHVVDIVSSKKEVLKALVVHLKHTGKTEKQTRR